MVVVSGGCEGYFLSEVVVMTMVVVVRIMLGLDGVFRCYTL